MDTSKMNRYVDKIRDLNRDFENVLNNKRERIYKQKMEVDDCKKMLKKIMNEMENKDHKRNIEIFNDGNI